MQKFIQIIPAPQHLSYEVKCSQGPVEYPVDIIGLTDDGDIVACAFDGDGCCVDVSDEPGFINLRFKSQLSEDLNVARESAPELVRLSEAARRAGISSELFMEGVISGKINIDLVKLGARFHYVRSSQLEKFLNG